MNKQILLTLKCILEKEYLIIYHIIVNDLASVAKWLRQRVVIPLFAGSIPVIRPKLIIYSEN